MPIIRPLLLPLARPLDVEALPSAAATFDPVSLFDGGKNGWLFDGSAGKSAFLQSAGGPVAVNGDPLGSVEDLSGNGNDVLQTTGGAKPVCNVSGGIRAITTADGKSISAALAVNMPPARTQVWVFRGGTLSSDATYLLQELAAGGRWDWLYPTNGPNAYMYDDNYAGSNLVVTPAWGQLVIFIIRKWFDGSKWQLTGSSYNSSGVLVQTRTFGFASGHGHSVKTIDIGLPFGTPQSTMYIPFALGVEGTLSDEAEMVAYCVSKFGAWSPA